MDIHGSLDEVTPQNTSIVKIEHPVIADHSWYMQEEKPNKSVGLEKKKH